MSRALLVLNSDGDRARAHSWVNQAPRGSRLEFKAPRRTIDQNSAMWAALTDIATALDWHGVKLSAQDWKVLFMEALKQEMRLVPNLNGNGFVNLGRSSSDLSREEMGDLLTLIRAFGDSHGVRFGDDQERAA